MLKKYFDQSIILEKIGKQYYLSITQLSSSMQDLSLNLVDGMQVGYRITENDGSRATYSFTLSEKSLSEELPFSVYVSTRNEIFNFTVALDLSSAKYVGEVDKTVERPAEFVPIFSTNAGCSYEAKQGQLFTLPQVNATFGEEVLEVSVHAYYLLGGEETEISIDNNRITLDDIGEYHVVYRAQSERYLTSLGNPTCVEKSITVISRAEGCDLVKISDQDGASYNDVSVIASEIGTDSMLYGIIAEKMQSISDRYQIVNVELFRADGNTFTLSDYVTLSIKADFTFNRNDIEVYLLSDEENLVKLSSGNGGSYVNVSTDKVGTFVICVPNLSNATSIWGYILVILSILIGLALVFIIVRSLKNKRRNKK